MSPSFWLYNSQNCSETSVHLRDVTPEHLNLNFPTHLQWCRQLLWLLNSTSLDQCCSICHSHFTLLHLAVLCSTLLFSSQVTCLLSCFEMTVGSPYCEMPCCLKFQANWWSVCLVCNFSHPLSSNAIK